MSQRAHTRHSTTRPGPWLGANGSRREKEGRYRVFRSVQSHLDLNSTTQRSAQHSYQEKLGATYITTHGHRTATDHRGHGPWQTQSKKNIKDIASL